MKATNSKTGKYEVHICRPLERSSYNIKEVLLVKANSIDKVISLPEVGNAVSKCYGKRLTVLVYPNYQSKIMFLEYKIAKAKSMCTNGERMEAVSVTQYEWTHPVTDEERELEISKIRAGL